MFKSVSTSLILLGVSQIIIGTQVRSTGQILGASS